MCGLFVHPHPNIFTPTDVTRRATISRSGCRHRGGHRGGDWRHCGGRRSRRGVSGVEVVLEQLHLYPSKQYVISSSTAIIPSKSLNLNCFSIRSNNASRFSLIDFFFRVSLELDRVRVIQIEWPPTLHHLNAAAECRESSLPLKC